MPKFKIGDKVIISRASTEEEDSKWDDAWVSPMNKYIGNECIITHLCENGVVILTNSGAWQYPIFVLKPVEKQMLFSFMYED